MLSTQTFQRLAIAVLAAYSLISVVSAAPVDSADYGALAARGLPVAGGVLGDGGSPLGAVTGATDALPLGAVTGATGGLPLPGGLPVDTLLSLAESVGPLGLASGALPVRAVGLGDLTGAAGSVTDLAGKTGAVSGDLPVLGSPSGSGNVVDGGLPVSLPVPVPRSN